MRWTHVGRVIARADIGRLSSSQCISIGEPKQSYIKGSRETVDSPSSTLFITLTIRNISISTKMLLQTVVAGLFLAANTQATPVGQDDPAFGEIVRFKRDAVLDTRDLELAELHGVNLTESRLTSMLW